MKPVVNIICRTHERPEFFKKCYESIKAQSYPNYQLLVGSDAPCDYYPYVIDLKPCELEYPQPPVSSYPAPWNKHCETLAKSCVPGLCMYLDDDDIFNTSYALQTIIDNFTDENQLLIWRVRITPDFVVPRADDFGQVIAPGNISGIGIAFHTKHLPVKWSTWSYGDFRVVYELITEKGLQPKFINAVLTGTQSGAHNGKN